MHNGEPITQLLPTMTAFPEPSDIFIKEQAWLANHFLPLLSIDLGELKPELTGTVVHMLNPLEPYDGHIGEKTTKYHTKYCGENFYAFRLTDDNRYEFLADEGYFLRSAIYHGELSEDYQPDTGTYSQYGSYANNQEAIRTYAESKERFQRTGKLTSKYGDTLKEQQFLDAFGGDVEGDNWCSSFQSWEHEAFGEHFPLKNSYYRYNNETMAIYCQEKPFFFVGQVAGYNWCSRGADDILMFYEPKNRIVLFTLNFT